MVSVYYGWLATLAGYVTMLVGWLCWLSGYACCAGWLWWLVGLDILHMPSGYAV
jgi:hypothetical protein